MNILSGIEEVHQLTEELANINNQQNNRQALDINSEYKSISELLQDEQMFRLDQDPQVFNYNSEDLNNNLELRDITDLNSIILSENYTPGLGDFDMFSDLLDTENMMEKKDYDTQSLSPLPAPLMMSSPPSPTPQSMMHQQEQQQQQPVIDTIIKMEGFDLVAFIEDDDKMVSNQSTILHKLCNYNCYIAQRYTVLYCILITFYYFFKN